MTEFHIIGLGNLCEFVIKDIDNNRTHGVFSACDKHNRESMQKFIDYVNEIVEENQSLKKENEELKIENQGQSDAIDGLQELMAHYNLEDLE